MRIQDGALQALRGSERSAVALGRKSGFKSAHPVRILKASDLAPPCLPHRADPGACLRCHFSYGIFPGWHWLLTLT